VHGRLEPALSPATCAFVYQEDALCGYLTARESLLLAAELRGLIPPSEVIHWEHLSDFFPLTILVRT